MTRRGVTTGSAVYVAWPSATSQHYIACILSVTPAMTTAAATAASSTTSSSTATATVVYEGGEVEVGVSPLRMKLAPGESLVTPYAGRPGQGRSARYMHALKLKHTICNSDSSAVPSSNVYCSQWQALLLVKVFARALRCVHRSRVVATTELR
jgi:hypothetical protein